MKIAYLISVYKDPEQLNRMIKALYREDTYFFIHIDAKTDIKDFSHFFDSPLQKGRIKFTNRRFYVQWGGWNQVNYQKELLESCIISGVNFDRVFILTGQDYPLFSNSRIEEELGRQPKKEYIKGLNLSVITSQKEVLDRIVLYHYCRDLRIPYKYKKIFSFGCRIIMKLLPIRKKSYIMIDGQRYDVYMSSSYMCLTYDCAKYVYEEMCVNKHLMKYFRWSFVPEEMVIPTIIFNSRFKEQAITVNGIYRGLKNLSSVTYFNYDKTIHVFTMDDYKELKESNMMFARKMQTGISDSLMNIIDEERKETCIDTVVQYV